ncbi:MAG: alkaline phosphatase family protein [Candidatus Rokuibacteriota bacterium]
MGRSKIVFIGIDAADKDLILDWASSGLMPTFRRLLERGTSGVIANPPGLYVGAVWPSFWTGQSPGHHGRYCYSQLKTGSYDFYSVNPTDTKGTPFWDHLTRAGRRSAIIDVPKTSPSPRIHGIQIVDWGTHDPELGFCTSPPSLGSEVQARFGPHPVRQCDQFVRRNDLGDLREALLLGVERKEAMLLHFLAEGEWDLFVGVFAESHCAGHQFWSIRDPLHPRHDPALARALGDPLQDVYVAIDRALGRLLAEVDEQTTVFVMASHGMGPHYDGTFLLDEMLRRLQAEPTTPASRRRMAQVAEIVWHTLPGRLRRWLKPARTRAKRALGNAVTRLDPGASRYFQVPNNDVYGGIRINLVSREPNGRVRPGHEYEAFSDALTKDLLAFINLDTGKPLVRQVLRTADLYTGARLHDLPDLLVEWDRDAPITRIHSPKTGTIEGVFRGTRSGDHKAEGLFVATGLGISAGRLASPVTNTRFAPTIATLLGTSIPEVSEPPIPELIPA